MQNSLQLPGWKVHSQYFPKESEKRDFMVFSEIYTVKLTDDLQNSVPGPPVPAHLKIFVCVYYSWRIIKVIIKVLL